MKPKKGSKIVGKKPAKKKKFTFGAGDYAMVMSKIKHLEDSLKQVMADTLKLQSAVVGLGTVVARAKDVVDASSGEEPSC